MARSVWTPPEEPERQRGPQPIDLMEELLRGATLLAALIVTLLLMGLVLMAAYPEYQP